MATTFAEIGDAVVAEIQAGITANLWPSMTVTRAYLHEFEQKDTTLRCSVAPASLAAGQIARSIIRADKTVIITVSKKLADTEKETIKPLTAGMEAMMDYYGQVRPLTGLNGAKVMAQVEQDGFYDAGLLWGECLFVSIFTVGFQTFDDT